MKSREINGIQYRQLIMHRVFYLAYLVEILFPFLLGKQEGKKYSLAVLSILVLCIIAEELMTFWSKLQSSDARKWIRLVQCIMASFIFFFWKGMQTSELIALTLVIMYLIDFFRAAELDRYDSVWFYMVCIAVPSVLIIATKIISVNDNYWVYLILNAIIMFVMLFVEACDFIDFCAKKERELVEERNRFYDEAEKNAGMLEIQQKIKNTNMLLNTQKNELQNANRRIQMANQEMQVQTDILRYIASSFEMSELLSQMVRTIMATRKLTFCGVYIKKGIYFNKEENYAIACDKEDLQDKLQQNIKQIYQYMSEQQIYEDVFHEELKESFPFLKGEDVKSLYLKVLEHEGVEYGVFVAGTQKHNAFADNMSFYDMLSAQFNIAVTSAKRYNEIQHMARKDGLTGINNRIYFNELFQKSANEVIRKNGVMSVALFDIDKFKNVNDTYGHLAGDEVIKRIASVTEACIDQYNGFVCRYGGEEFVAVLPDRNLADATPIIQSLFGTICSQVVDYNGTKIPMSVSIGLTSYPEVCKSSDELLRRADWCMYYAKEHGRHQINIDDGSIQRD